MSSIKAERLPGLNDFRFIKANDSLAENINTWAPDRGFFCEHRRKWQYGNNYRVKRNRYDTFSFYIDTLAVSVKVHLYNEIGEELTTVISGIGYTGTSVPGNTYTRGGVDYVYQSIYHTFKFSDIYTMALSQQVFYIGLECDYDTGDGAESTWYISEPIYVRKGSWPHTMLIEATNGESDYNVMFEAFPPTLHFPGITFRQRVEAYMSDEPAPASTDTVFKDQDYSIQKLKSVPYRLFDLVVGGKSGVPKYMLDKINRCLSCDTVLIDGVQWVKDEGANWSLTPAPDYMMFAGKIRLQEYEHDGGMVYTNEGDAEERYHDDFHDDSHD